MLEIREQDSEIWCCTDVTHNSVQLTDKQGALSCTTSVNMKAITDATFKINLDEKHITQTFFRVLIVEVV